MIKNLLKWILILVLCFSAAFYLTFRPSYVSEVAYRDGVIKIDRDEYGVAKIHVSSMEEYLYGLGTISAQDRLFQISFRAYAAQGRLSQFLGEKSLQFDRFMREVNLKKWADLRAQRFKTENFSQYTKFAEFARGINDRVAQMKVLPMQFYLTGAKWQNFTVNHLFYFAIQFQWAISLNMIDEYTRSALLANYTKEEIDWILPNRKDTWAFKSIPIVTEDEIPQRLKNKHVQDKLQKIKFNPQSVEHLVELDIFEFVGNQEATNCWAVLGEHTESGSAIIVNDPHLENVIPSQFYPFRFQFALPNGRNFSGVGGSIPGSFHFYGNNGYFALGQSISHGDNQDLFREKIEGSQYLLDGKWRDLKIRNETIFVKTSKGLRKEIYQVRETHRGPIIHYIFNSLGSYNLQNDTLSLAWTGFNSQWKSYIEFTYSVLTNNFDELRNIMQNVSATLYNSNMLAATADNHIVMQQSGLHPIRRLVQSGTYIKDGSESLHDWVGLVPAIDRMHIYDPPKGYIINANNRVAENDYYDGYLDYTIYTARADRIDEALKKEFQAGRKISDDFAKKIILDTVDVYCRQILPEITEVVEESRPFLSNFDCDFTASSTQASIYEVFMFQLYHSMKPFSPEKMGLISFHQMQQGIFNYIHFAFRGDSAKQSIMRQSWKKTLTHLTSHFGTDDSSKWAWGALHVDHARHVPFRAHPLLSKVFNLKFPGVGNTHTPNMAKMEHLQFGNFETTNRASSRTIYGFGNRQKNYYLIDSGASENILSKHYSDQWELFRKGELMSGDHLINKDDEL